MINEWVYTIVLSAQSQTASRFENLGWHNIGWDLQNWVFSLVIPIVILLTAGGILAFVFRWRSSVKKESKKRNIRADKLNSMVKKCKISENEVKFINILACFVKNEDMLSVIENPDVFERCVDMAMANAAKGPPESTENTAEIIGSLRRKIGFDVYPIDKQLFSTRAIPTGQVCALYGDVSNKEPLIKSAVVVVNGERSMKFRFKPERENTATVAEGSNLHIAFSRANDGFYGAQVPVLATPMHDTIEVGHTLDIKRSQLRKFVRVSASTSVKCRMIKPVNTEQPSLPVGETFEASMRDISGGGVSFSHLQSLQPGDTISLNFHLGSAQLNGLQGTILRVSERTANGQKEFLHHVKFNQIELVDQEKIVRFIFEHLRLLSTWNTKGKK